MQTLKTPVSLCVALFLAACTSVVKEQPYTEDENSARAKADQVKMYADQEPVTGPISFYEAAARALKYNLDYASS